MPLELTDFSRDPEDRIYVHCYNQDAQNMAAGERIQVRVDSGSGPVAIMDETVPTGKQWIDVHFQFQAEERPA